MLIGMHHIAFSMQFRGQWTWLSPGMVTARAIVAERRAGHQVDPEGVRRTWSRATATRGPSGVPPDLLDETRFEESARSSFGGGQRCASAARRGHDHAIAAARPSPRRRRLDCGRRRGAFHGATGRRLELPPLRHGDLTDLRLGVLFLRTTRERTRGATSDSARLRRALAAAS